ncbi:uncharacterized protein EV422DRAFT_341919 [Fimicolochytrium jonesii]|uniref:uncharacterized protein n=1 Tax=Fimicolochytrium jonesii TaxID=1396493 RepID=UPI0022FE5B80|nr:uncharacterized protein EV422DRAFT_341919 [Fimicolochytrium jonesii]KAI8815824.1 hypothetical protein EV422DRAFT_341919 [Fimicolochytrium jonesii]
MQAAQDSMDPMTPAYENGPYPMETESPSVAPVDSSRTYDGPDLANAPRKDSTTSSNGSATESDSLFQDQKFVTSSSPQQSSSSVLKAIPTYLQKKPIPMRSDSDALLEKSLGPPLFFFAEMDASVYNSFCELLDQTEPTIGQLHMNPEVTEGAKYLCMVTDMVWAGFLYKFVLDYNLTFGEGEQVVKWHGRSPPVSLPLPHALNFPNKNLRLMSFSSPLDHGASSKFARCPEALRILKLPVNNHPPSLPRRVVNRRMISRSGRSTRAQAYLHLSRYESAHRDQEQHLPCRRILVSLRRKFLNSDKSVYKAENGGAQRCDVS